jgi:hypothetical protein
MSFLASIIDQNSEVEFTMTIFFKILAKQSATVLTTGLVISGALSLPSSILPSGNGTAVAQTVMAQAITIPASLPHSADVVLKSGRTVQGQVTGFDPSRQILTIQGNSSHAFPMSEIERVTFSTDSVTLNANGQPIERKVRGEGAPAGSPVTWNPVAISGLRFNQTYGTAQIVLGSSVSNPGSTNHTYVLNELRFNPQQGTMAITATPY